MHIIMHEFLNAHIWLSRSSQYEHEKHIKKNNNIHEKKYKNLRLFFMKLLI